MLESIQIRNFATYDADGVEIIGLKKVNFIYGVNGSGKTTITKFVANPNDSVFSGCSKRWQNDVRLKALVYNKDFRDNNFGKGSIDGVFTLGQATKDEIEEINKLQVELLAVKESGLGKKVGIEKLEAEKVEGSEAFKESAWKDVYKKFDAHFSDAFAGVKSSKELFKKKLLAESTNNSAELKTYDELKENATTILGNAPVSLNAIPKVDFKRISEIEGDLIWKKKIIGKADVEIANLIQRLNLNDWVNQGREYIEEGETCPFCQGSTITLSFRKQLEEYFDETFTSDTNLVKSLTEEYQNLWSNIINVLDEIETNQKDNANSKLDIANFSASLKTLASQHRSNDELIKAKSKESSRSIDLVSTKLQYEEIEKLIGGANDQITKHNSLVVNYTKEKRSLIEQVWKYVATDYKDRIDTHNKKQNGLQTGIDKMAAEKAELSRKYKELEEDIRIRNKDVTSVQPSVDEINRTLKSFGFTNFKIVPSSVKNQYQIQREDGSIADATLSEGEVTFITFLYFLQLCKGSTSQDTINSERILVIDDPISSLDSNVLFIVSSLLKEIIKGVKLGDGNIKQLIVLTHNVYFHKEVSFVDGRTPRNGDTHYWILRRNGNRTLVQSFEMENPIKNSYELLWQELKNKEQNSGTTIQNSMRRILEHYFKILGKYKDDDIIDSFEVAEEKEICRSLISWINDGSHVIPDDLYVEHQSDATDKYLNVFERIFEQMGHSEHYKMMMGNGA